MNSFIEDVRQEFGRHKDLADQAMAGLDDAAFFRKPGELVNPVALIVKHLAGNMLSRWTDFLETDGEKPDRDRDGEFVLADQDTRPELLRSWERGWDTCFATLSTLTDADLGRTVTIRGEPHTVRQVLLRGLGHVAYHTGQVLYLARLLRPEAPWLTIEPGRSRDWSGQYLRPDR